MKISYSIFLSFFFILLLLGITTYNDYRLSEDIKENSDYFSRSTEIMKNATRFQRNVLSMESGLRGYLLTGEKSFVNSYDAANKDNNEILSELTTLITDTSQRNLLNDIKTLNNEWTDVYTEPLKLSKALSAQSGEHLIAFNKTYREKAVSGEEKRSAAKLQDKLREFAASEYKLRDVRKEKLAQIVNRTKATSYFLTIISIIASIVIVVLLARRIARRIKQMTVFADTIAKGNYDTNIKAIGNDELSPLVHSLNSMAEELSTNISLLKRSNKELDQFAHVVSHDMKTPLRGISNIVSWIEEDHKEELSPKVVEYIDLIKGRIFRAENLIAGLLAYARIDKETVEKEEVNVNDLIQEVLDNMASTNINAKISVLPIIRTERILLFQIFSNLISNAVKYNEKDTIEIDISFKEHPDKYEFFVKDNGIGIAPNHYQRIFTIFETLTDKDSFESAGVGLAIVKKILDSKQQEIRVSSQLEEGSVFVFTWPKE